MSSLRQPQPQAAPQGPQPATMGDQMAPPLTEQDLQTLMASQQAAPIFGQLTPGMQLEDQERAQRAQIMRQMLQAQPRPYKPRPKDEQEER